MRALTAGLAIAALAAALGACSSSSSSSTHAPPTAKTTTSPATVTGTERIAGTITGRAVVTISAPTYPLTFTGPVNTTGTFTPPNSNAVHQAATFKTNAGDLVVAAVVSGQNTQPQDLGNCLYRIPITATYVVDGDKSTGRFAGAAGHGTVTATTRFYVPKLASGKCNLSQTAQPLAKGAISVFTAAGPLTVRA